MQGKNKFNAIIDIQNVVLQQSMKWNLNTELTNWNSEGPYCFMSRNKKNTVPVDWVNGIGSITGDLSDRDFVRQSVG